MGAPKIEALRAALGGKPEQLGRPVSWLLGVRLIESVKAIAMYTLYKGELDARDWMVAPGANVETVPDGTDELWFDYIADIGDGQEAMYSMAFLCQDDLHIEPLAGVAGVPDARALWRRAQATTPSGERPGDLAALAVPATATEDRAGWPVLRRGQFLFVGGDTAYHVADHATLRDQVCRPFLWAYDDLLAAGREPGRAVHRLYGIPGNHDYYDQLVGFNRMFRKPCTPEEVAVEKRFPPLQLPGFERAQEASYLAIRLPWGWQLWGVDTADDYIDFRQRRFFESLGAPRRLILATPEPAFALGQLQWSAKQKRGLELLRLPVPRADDDKRVAIDLGPIECRLDLAGDVHHYARHSQPPAGGDLDAPVRFASVQAGIGGAFHHPSYTWRSAVRRDAVYPDEKTSRAAIAGRLFNPYVIFTGGAVGLVGALIAAIVYATSLRDRMGWLFGRLLPGPAGQTMQAALVPESRAHLGASVACFLALVGAVLVVVAASVWATWRIRKWRKIFARADHRAEESMKLHKRIAAYGFWLLAALVLAAPLFLVDRFPPADVLFYDVAFFVVVSLVIGGLVAFAVSGAKRLRRRGKAVFAAMGVLHAVMQLSVPLFLVHARAPVAAAVLVCWAGFGLVGWALMVRGLRYGLLAAWLIQGLGFPAILAVSAHSATPSSPLMMWLLFGAAALVGLFGACLQFGWYLAVASLFDGHNNEAGGAARLKEFKQFIRFRLTPAGLTGYVIALDRVERDGARLRPRLVDVFWIEPPAGDSVRGRE